MTWTRLGVRGRITLAATIAVAMVLALVGVAFVVLLQRDLLRGSTLRHASGPKTSRH